MKSIFYLLFASILFCGCSQHYRGMAPAKTRFDENYSFQDLKIRYKSNYLSSMKMHPLADKSGREEVALYALEISNDGLDPVVLGKTHLVSVGGQAGTLLESTALHKSMRLRIGKTLPTFLLSPMLGFVIIEDEEAVDAETGPILFLIGPALVGMQMLGMASQNARLKQDIKKWNLYGQTILPGERVWGIIGMSTRGKTGSKNLNLYRIQRY